MKNPLQEALECQKKAAGLGFDWPGQKPVLEKLEEEVEEIKEALENKEPIWRIQEEMGDLVFQWINLCRHLGICPTQTLLNAKDKFEKRLDLVKKSAQKRSLNLKELSLQELESLWQEAKKETSL